MRNKQLTGRVRMTEKAEAKGVKSGLRHNTRAWDIDVGNGSFCPPPDILSHFYPFLRRGYRNPTESLHLYISITLSTNIINPGERKGGQNYALESFQVRCCLLHFN